MSLSPYDLADRNLVAATREHARWQQPCKLVEADGLLMMAGPNEFPAAFRNCVMRVDAKVSAVETLSRAIDFFGRRNRGFTIMVRAGRDGDIDPVLVTAGLELRGNSPCMLIEETLPEPVVPPDIRIETFVSERHVHDAVDVIAEAYESLQLPPNEARLYFSRPAALLTPHIVGFVAYRGAQPLSTALTVLSGDSAGVYWVATVNQGRHRGLGEIVTRLATNAGFAHGASVVTLQASSLGEPIYRRLGYRDHDRLRRYRRLPPT
jgi:ribosomal protein S18 acetylase RimI-like enzyme